MTIHSNHQYIKAMFHHLLQSSFVISLIVLPSQKSSFVISSIFHFQGTIKDGDIAAIKEYSVQLNASRVKVLQACDDLFSAMRETTSKDLLNICKLLFAQVVA
ncbi:hypothetical protein Ccrd_014057 [Cynara cardunculus var. scolymus]|uniref:Uncharacterized protein n=1 Tax=Cynara cardunculus var. scolymus TaxID=59895 RepID=A0A103YEE9_CYNCS|nr:hypothetical protein Ccrd_014057 [Cynara cardunculus var. scolymus]